MKWLLLTVPWLLTTVTANDVDSDHPHLRSGNDFEHRMLQASFDVTANWEEGALSMHGSVPASAHTGTVTVSNDPNTGRVLFKEGPNLLGRTNGNGDNGVASHAFTFKYSSATKTVPIAFGKKNGRDTLWTPWFAQCCPMGNGIRIVYMSQFVTDNGAGDEDMTVGVIERGDFRAVDGDFGASFSCGRPGKVCFQKKVGTSWQQIGRTNGPGDDGNLISFAVLTIRVTYTLDAGKIVNVNQDVPIAQINGITYGQYLGLQTPLSTGNIGTQTMLCLPKLT